MKQVTGRNQKVNMMVVDTVKNMVDAGTKDYIIAEAFGVSIATVQNIKRSDYDYGKYRKMVTNQMVNWKRIRDGKTNTTEVSSNGLTFAAAEWFRIKVADFDRLEEKVDLLLGKLNKIFPKVK